MRTWIASAVVFALTLAPLGAGGDKGDVGEVKEALQALQDFIGTWKGNGTSEKDRSEIWKEAANWSWRFKGKDVSLTIDMPQSKHFKKGEIRYLPAKEKYQVTLTGRTGGNQVFLGKLKKNVLTLERINPETKATEQIRMNTAGGGDRLIYTFAQKPAGRTMFFRQYQVGYTREGVTFGTAGAKKPECVVTGGLGTMAVSYMGQTYYVCCSGCRDAFNENPAKIIAEYKARKKAGR